MANTAAPKITFITPQASKVFQFLVRPVGFVSAL